MMNNDTNRLTDAPMTVADLRNLLDHLPDHNRRKPEGIVTVAGNP